MQKFGLRTGCLPSGVPLKYCPGQSTAQQGLSRRATTGPHHWVPLLGLIQSLVSSQVPLLVPSLSTQGIEPRCVVLRAPRHQLVPYHPGRHKDALYLCTSHTSYPRGKLLKPAQLRCVRSLLSQRAAQRRLSYKSRFARRARPGPAPYRRASTTPSWRRRAVPLPGYRRGVPPLNFRAGPSGGQCSPALQRTCCTAPGPGSARRSQPPRPPAVRAPDEPRRAPPVPAGAGRGGSPRPDGAPGLAVSRPLPSSPSPFFFPRPGRCRAVPSRGV